VEKNKLAGWLLFYSVLLIIGLVVGAGQLVISLVNAFDPRLLYEVRLLGFVNVITLPLTIIFGGIAISKIFKRDISAIYPD
jgi:hypothetical protein